MRRALFIFLPLIAAAASVYNLVDFRLNNLMDPAPSDLTNAVWYGAFAVIVVFALLPMFWRNVWLLVLSILIIVAAGFAPRAADFYEATIKIDTDLREGADVEMEFQSSYLDRSDDVDARAASRTPYTAAEALEFLEFAADSDLSWRSLSDHTPQTFALVEQAMTAGILDPNALMPTPTADSPAVTLTLAFYDKRIKPASPHTIKKHDWDVLQILVAGGADLSMADAASLRADLARTVILGEGRFIELQ